MTPIRIQRKRTKGWKAPENTVYVGRPTKWGNRWTPEKYWDAGYNGSIQVASQHCVDAYRAWILGKRHWAHSADFGEPLLDVSELRGKNLMCWCPLDRPCHADALLEIANAGTTQAVKVGDIA